VLLLAFHVVVSRHKKCQEFASKAPFSGLNFHCCRQQELPTTGTAIGGFAPPPKPYHIRISVPLNNFRLNNSRCLYHHGIQISE
jgi:hypothetical protein